MYIFDIGAFNVFVFIIISYYLKAVIFQFILYDMDKLGFTENRYL